MGEIDLRIQGLNSEAETNNDAADDLPARPNARLWAAKERIPWPESDAKSSPSTANQVTNA
jgi:hypothetical protein